MGLTVMQSKSAANQTIIKVKEIIEKLAEVDMPILARSKMYFSEGLSPAGVVTLRQYDNSYNHSPSHFLFACFTRNL